MKKKLRDDRGETLVEILASILICALSVTLLFGSVMTSSSLDLQTQDMDQQYYEALTKAERQGNADVPSGVSVPTTVTVVAKGEAGGRQLDIKFYGTEQLLSYAYTGGAGP